MVDSSAGSMISSSTGIFLSFLHAKVGREGLVVIYQKRVRVFHQGFQTPRK